MSGGLQPNSALGHKPPFPEFRRVRLEKLPFEGARSQNIENNPMQSSRRPLACDEAI